MAKPLEDSDIVEALRVLECFESQTSKNERSQVKSNTSANINRFYMRLVNMYLIEACLWNPDNEFFYSSDKRCEAVKHLSEKFMVTCELMELLIDKLKRDYQKLQDKTNKPEWVQIIDRHNIFPPSKSKLQGARKYITQARNFITELGYAMLSVEDFSEEISSDLEIFNREYGLSEDFCKSVWSELIWQSRNSFHLFCSSGEMSKSKTDKIHWTVLDWLVMRDRFTALPSDWHQRPSISKAILMLPYLVSYCRIEDINSKTALDRRWSLLRKMQDITNYSPILSMISIQNRWFHLKRWSLANPDHPLANHIRVLFPNLKYQKTTWKDMLEKKLVYYIEKPTTMRKNDIEFKTKINEAIDKYVANGSPLEPCLELLKEYSIFKLPSPKSHSKRRISIRSRSNSDDRTSHDDSDLDLSEDVTDPKMSATGLDVKVNVVFDSDTDETDNCKSDKSETGEIDLTNESDEYNEPYRGLFDPQRDKQNLITKIALMIETGIRNKTKLKNKSKTKQGDGDVEVIEDASTSQSESETPSTAPTTTPKDITKVNLTKENETDEINNSTSITKVNKELVQEPKAIKTTNDLKRMSKRKSMKISKSKVKKSKVKTLKAKDKKVEKNKQTNKKSESTLRERLEKITGFVGEEEWMKEKNLVQMKYGIKKRELSYEASSNPTSHDKIKFSYSNKEKTVNTTPVNDQELNKPPNVQRNEKSIEKNVLNVTPSNNTETYRILIVPHAIDTTTIQNTEVANEPVAVEKTLPKAKGPNIASLAVPCKSNGDDVIELSDSDSDSDNPILVVDETYDDTSQDNDENINEINNDKINDNVVIEDRIKFNENNSYTMKVDEMRKEAINCDKPSTSRIKVNLPDLIPINDVKMTQNNKEIIIRHNNEAFKRKSDDNNETTTVIKRPNAVKVINLGTSDTKEAIVINRPNPIKIYNFDASGNKEANIIKTQNPIKILNYDASVNNEAMVIKKPNPIKVKNTGTSANNKAMVIKRPNQINVVNSDASGNKEAKIIRMQNPIKLLNFDSSVNNEAMVIKKPNPIKVVNLGSSIKSVIANERAFIPNTNIEKQVIHNDNQVMNLVKCDNQSMPVSQILKLRPIGPSGSTFAPTVTTHTKPDGTRLKILFVKRQEF